MINLSIADADNILRPRITVMGVGGAGGNAVNNMIRAQLEGCDFVAANTDAQALANSLAPRKIQLGISQTRGLGAGSKPDVGRSAAEEQINDILACLEQTDMVFVTAGMGGGTGTGAAPVIARVAREAGILTVGVVTKPFDFEGNRRRQLAEQGLAELQQYVDTLIIIPNQNLFRLANERTTFADAFRMADEVLHCGVRGITDLMVMPGFMNLDFADVKTVMGEMGKAMMGTGEANGENRALRAAEAAISNPLLEDTSMKGAKGVLINITGGLDMTLFEVDQAANRIREEVDPDAQIKVGSTLSENLDGVIRVSVIATGIEAQTATMATPPQAHPGFRTVNAPKPQTPPPHAGFFTTPPTAPASRHAEPAQEAPVAPQPQQTAQFAAMAEPQFQAPPQAPPQTAPQPQSAFVQHLARVAESAPLSQAAPQPAPQQALRGQQVGGNFVAPRPLEINRAPQMAQQQPLPRATQSTTLSAQSLDALDPSAQQKGGKRAESLFTRITGFGLVRPSIEQDAPAQPQQPTQTRLNVEPNDRVQSSQNEEEDLLEIPAFLRRQTNH
ncbi:MAG: cell division protein FtsZ [Alphaproteobacteria bacterium]